MKTTDLRPNAQLSFELMSDTYTVLERLLREGSGQVLVGFSAQFLQAENKRAEGAFLTLVSEDEIRTAQYRFEFMGFNPALHAYIGRLIE